MQVKVCDICGDPGYADLLVVCNECGEVAEHVYCMQTLLECDSQVYWSCEECNVKQRTSEQKMAVTLPRPQVAQSQPQSSKRQGDDPSSPPASKKQAIKSSNAVAYQSEVILQRDNSFVVSKATNADNCGKSQQTCSSVRPLHSEDGLSKAPGAGKVENGSTALVQACNGSVLPPLPRETSVKTVEIPKVKFLPVSSSANFSGGLRGTATTGSVDRESGTVNKLGSQSSSHLGSANPGLLSPGSKSAMLAKSGDPLPSFLLSSRPAISPRGQAALRSSKDGVSGSGQLSLPSQSSGLKPSGGKFRGSNATVCALASPIPDSEQQNDGHPGKLSMNVDVKGIKEPSGNSNCVTGEKCDVDLNAVPLISLSENCRPKEAFLSTKENTHFTSTSVEVRSPTVCENAKGFRLTSEDMKGSVMPKMPLERLVQTKGLESANEGPKVLESIKMDTDDCGFDKDPKGLVSLEVDKEDSKVLILSREKAVDLTLTGEDQTIFPLLKQDMKGLSISSKDPLHLLENEFRDSVSAKDDFERSMPVCKDPKSNGENIEEASVKASCHQNIQSAECLHKTGVFSQNELKSACNIRAPQTNETTVPEFNLSRNATSCALTSFDLSPPSGVIDGSVQGMDQTPKLHKSYMGRVSSSAAPAVQQTSTNRAHESINSSIERETERGTSNITLAAWNNTTQRPTKQNATSFVDMGNNLLKAGPPVAPRTFGRERVVAARKGHSTTRHSEMNLASSLAMQNQTSNPKERANMSGNLSSSTNISSRTPLKGALLRLPQQKPLTLPQSQILWKEKAPSVKELQGAFTQSNVEANVLGPGSTLPLRSNIEDSVSRELKLPNMDGNDGGEENMDIDMEGGKDVGIPERPVPRPDNQIERASARHSSKLSLPLDSKRNSNQPSSILFSQQEDGKAGGPMLFECDQSLPVPSRVESERTLERMNEQVSRMSSEKSIDLTQERACLGGTKKELDEPSGLDLSSQICHPQVRHQSSSRRSLEVMPDRGNGGGPQKRLHKKELPHHIGSPKGSQVLEGKDILKGAGPQGQNYQSGIDSQYQEFPPCSDLAGCNPLQSPTENLTHRLHPLSLATFDILLLILPRRY